MDYSQITGNDNIRHTYRPIVGTDGQPAYAQYVSLAPVTPLGHNQLTVSTVAVPLPSVPTETRRVVIRSLGQPINFRDDGVDPTSTSGFPIFADEILIYDNPPPEDFAMILSSDATGDSDVRIIYYG